MTDVRCIECGKPGTRRVCDECFDRFDQQVQANDAALMAALARQDALDAE